MIEKRRKWSTRERARHLAKNVEPYDPDKHPDRYRSNVFESDEELEAFIADIYADRRLGSVGGRIEARMKTYERISVDRNMMGGVPCIRGMRIPVATVVGMIADGITREEILKEFPELEPEDITEALEFAADAVREFGDPDA